MKEIVERLHENRQVELAKSILESAGYKVEKKSIKRLKESGEESSKVIVHSASEHKPRGYGTIDSYYGYEHIDHPTLGEFYISVGIDGDVRTDGRPWEFIVQQKLTSSQKDFVRRYKSELSQLMISGDNDITINDSNTYSSKSLEDPMEESSESHPGWEYWEMPKGHKGPWEPKQYNKEYMDLYLTIYPPQPDSGEEPMTDWHAHIEDAHGDSSVYEYQAGFKSFEEAEAWINQWLDKNGYNLEESKKLKESYEWYQTDDGIYMIRGYFDADGEGDLPYIDNASNGEGFIAFLSGNDYRGKEFSELRAAQRYIEQNINPEDIEMYQSEDGPWNW